MANDNTCTDRRGAACLSKEKVQLLRVIQVRRLSGSSPKEGREKLPLGIGTCMMHKLGVEADRSAVVTMQVSCCGSVCQWGCYGRGTAVASDGPFCPKDVFEYFI